MDAEQDVEHQDEYSRAKLTGSLTKVASVSINDLDTLWISRNYTGLGSELKYMEVYVIRGHKYLGRFEMQLKPTFDAAWINDSQHPHPPTEKDIASFRKVRMTMLGAVDKIWS
jgi:hypothetical protein